MLKFILAVVKLLRYILRCLWETILVIMDISEGVIRLGLNVHRLGSIDIGFLQLFIALV